MIAESFAQRAAISPAWALPTMYEDSAGTTVHRATLPVAMGRQGISVPADGYVLKGTTATGAGIQRSGVAPIQADRTAVVDRNRLVGGPGPAARGRPV